MLDGRVISWQRFSAVCLVNIIMDKNIKNWLIVTIAQGSPERSRRALTCQLAVLAIALNLEAGGALGNPRHPDQNTLPSEMLISASSLEREQQAKQLYDRGRLVEAEDILQKLDAEYETKGDELGRSRVWRNLALIYQQSGELLQASQAIDRSLGLLQSSSLRGNALQKSLARILEIQGGLELDFGRAEQAADIWKQAALHYEQIGDLTGATRSQINRARALRQLGLYRRALETLSAVKNFLSEQPDTLLKATALESLGDALRLVGRGQESREILQESLAIAEKLSSAESIASILLSLGNAARSRSVSVGESGQDPETALNFYRKAALNSPSPEIRLQAQLNLLSLLVEKQEWSEALGLIPEIQSDLSELPLSRTAVNAHINLASSLMKIPIAEGQCPLPNIGLGATHLERQLSAKAKISSQMLRLYKIKSQKSNLEAKNSFCNVANAELLATAVNLARSLEDKRGESYALGNLGKLYEQNEQWDDARELTERSLLLAQEINAGDIAYQWQWQLGRILQVQGERESAIAAYSEATHTLQSLRGDLVAISSDVQFNFRESIEPVYRELVGILLQPSFSSDGLEGSAREEMQKVSQANLLKARDAIESLQLAELDNFFRDACLETRPAQIDEIDPKAAVIYTIILPDRLEAIVKLTGKPLRHYTTFEPQAEIEKTLLQIRSALTEARRRSQYKKSLLPPSQKVYDWLIRPIEEELESTGVQTLVFVLDGELRNIPIAALYDGNRYLVEKYSIALTPGLQLLDPKPIAREELYALAAGVSQARQQFPPLPGVPIELQRIQAEIPANILLDSSFTEPNFKATLERALRQNGSESPSVVHIATHGEFSSKAEDTYIITWDDRINANELDDLLRPNPGQGSFIELLVLSACRTAFGDNRATLGLAGVAVRAGARSTVGSLWYVSDISTTKLMAQFYQELARPNASKAEALRRAQISILQDSQFFHPYFWSAFVLVGNWL